VLLGLKEDVKVPKRALHKVVCRHFGEAALERACVAVILQKRKRTTKERRNCTPSQGKCHGTLP